MKEKTIYKLMVKRLIFYNIILITTLNYIINDKPLIKIFQLILFLDVILNFIEIYKRDNYPFYCYIYPKFKYLFDYENNKLKVKRNKNLRKIWIIPLIFIIIFNDYIAQGIPPIDLSRIIFLIIIVKNILALIDIWEFKVFKLIN